MINWVASYPKSGNTWVRLLLGRYAEIVEDAGYEVRWGDINQHWLQTVSPTPLRDVPIGQQAQLRGAALYHLAAMLNKPTWVKTHHAAIKVNDLPLFPAQWTRKAIYVVRDPRDVVASFQAHMGLETREAAIDRMAHEEMQIKGEAGPSHYLSSWAVHVRTWTDSPTELHSWRPEEPLVVRYEDLHADTEGELVRMLGHMGVEAIEHEAVEQAVRENRFDKLRERESEQAFPEASDHQDRFFRKGETGGWREELTAAQAQRIEDAFGDVMEQMGYETGAAVCGAPTRSGGTCERPSTDGYCWQHSELSEVA